MKKIYAVIILSCVGWLNSFYTLVHRQNVIQTGITEKSFCNLGTAADCDAVALSSYSEYFGIPVSAFGLVFFFLVICFAFMTLPKKNSNEDSDQLNNTAHSWLSLTVITGLISSIFLSYVLYNKIGTLCVLCLIIHAINIANFVLVMLINKDKKTSVFPKCLLPLNSLGLIALFAVPQLFSGPVVNRFVFGKNDTRVSSKDINMIVQDYFSNDTQDIETDKLPYLGSADAKIILVEYSDFECPYCRKFSKTLPSFMRAYDSKVKFVFKHFPIDNSCNPNIESAIHAFACYAAKTVQCVFKEYGNDSFWKAKYAIFDIENLSKERIDAAVTKLGLDQDKISTCRESTEMHKEMEKQSNEAVAVGVEGTPSLFINGKKLRTALVPKVIQEVISQLENKE